MRWLSFNRQITIRTLHFDSDWWPQTHNWTLIFISHIINVRWLYRFMDLYGFIAGLFVFLFRDTITRSTKMRRRSRRGRMFALGLLFIIYSAINVYSSSDIDINSAARSEFDPNDLSTILPKSSTSGSNDDIAGPASTPETTQSTTSTTKGSVSADFLSLFSFYKAPLLNNSQIIFKKKSEIVFMKCFIPLFDTEIHSTNNATIKSQSAANISTETSELHTASHRTISTTFASCMVSWKGWLDHTRSYRNIHISGSSYRLWWLLCIELGSDLRRATTIARRSWCNLYGSRFVYLHSPSPLKMKHPRVCLDLQLTALIVYTILKMIGSSAPELGTVIIGVFFAKDDIGVSGVIGSAVFNIMFVISVCALFSGTVCHLNWWPLVRDCFFYSLSIIVMLIIMLNDYISWVSQTNQFKKAINLLHTSLYINHERIAFTFSSVFAYSMRL